MKTTLHLDDQIMRRARREATRQGTTISALVETALRRLLATRPGAERLPPPPSASAARPRVDLANREALYPVLDER